MTTDTTPTLIQTPFGFDSTALEVVEDIDLAGKRAIVTGGASGIGVETVRALASAGAEVTIAARNLATAEEVAADVKGTTGNEAVLVRRWSWSTATRSTPSPPPGTARSTSSSTTPA